MQNRKHCLIGILICLTLAVMGCRTPQKPPPPVAPVSPPVPVCESLERFNQVDPAIAAAKSNLARQECGASFQASYEQLIEIAEMNPHSSNRKRFGDFIDWGYTQRMLSSVEANTLYKEYFSTEFIALPDNVRVCDAAFDKMERALESELRKKEKGLAKATANQGEYQRAHREMNQVLNIIEGVGMACEAQ